MRRAQVGEKREVLAQPQQAGFRAHLVGHVGPFRAADRGEHHRVGGLGARHVGVADRLAMRVIGAAADQALFEFERGEALAPEKPWRPSRLRPSLRGRCRRPAAGRVCKRSFCGKSFRSARDYPIFQRVKARSRRSTICGDPVVRVSQAIVQASTLGPTTWLAPRNRNSEQI